jgi:hypothetical protein
MSEQRTSRVVSNIIRPGSPKDAPTFPGRAKCKYVPACFVSDPEGSEKQNVLAWHNSAGAVKRAVRKLIEEAVEHPGEQAWRVYKYFGKENSISFLPMKASAQGQRVMIKYYHRRGVEQSEREGDSIRTMWYSNMIPSLIEEMDYPWLRAVTAMGPGARAPLSQRFRHQFFFGILKVEETGVLYRKAGDLLYACDITLRGPEGIIKSIFLRENLKRADDGVEVEYRRILLDAAHLFNDCFTELARLDQNCLTDARKAFAEDGLTLAKAAKRLIPMNDHTEAIQAIDAAILERFAKTLQQVILPKMANHGLIECARLIEHVRKERLCSSDDPNPPIVKFILPTVFGRQRLPVVRLHRHNPVFLSNDGIMAFLLATPGAIEQLKHSHGVVRMPLDWI